MFPVLARPTLFRCTRPGQVLPDSLCRLVLDYAAFLVSEVWLECILRPKASMFRHGPLEYDLEGRLNTNVVDPRGLLRDIVAHGRRPGRLEQLGYYVDHSTECTVFATANAYVLYLFDARHDVDRLKLWRSDSWQGLCAGTSESELDVLRWALCFRR